jgi:hypothetical protein
MDWNLAIEKNNGALKRTLAMLAALAGVMGGGSASEPACATTLPRHRHRFVLRLLRPAEAATRRLIMIAARGLVVKIRPFRPSKQAPKRPLNRKNGYGTGIVIRPGPLPEWARQLMPKRSPSLSLPLLDTLPHYGLRRRNARPAIAPRVRLLGGDPINPLFRRPEPPPPAPPTPDDPLDATRIHHRLEAVRRALDDLPGQAQRMARWAARRDARLARERGEVDVANSNRGECLPTEVGRTPRLETSASPKRRHQRLSVMRPGRPPGFRKRSGHEIHAVLNELHGLAVYARDGP